MKMTDGSTHSQAVISNVPVLHPSGGGFVIAFPLAPGDPVLLVFSARGISQFKKDFTESPPDDDAIFSYKDAIALPGFGATEINKIGNGITIQTEDGSAFITISQVGNVTINTAGRIELNSGGDMRLNSAGDMRLNSAGDMRLNSAGDLYHNATNIGEDHTHGGVEQGGSSTGRPD